MTIYLDAIWLLNFFLDWMILMLTHSFAKSQSGRSRLLIGAIVASLLVPIQLFYPHSFWTTPLGKGLYSIFIVFTAFGWCNIRLFFRQWLMFYFVSFAIGGGLFGIYFMLNKQVDVSTGMVVTHQTGFGDGVSWLFVTIGFPIVWYFTKRRLDKLVVQKMKYDEMVTVTISINDKAYDATAFIDSGNQLTDPITNQPVVICSESYMKQWFSEKEWLAFQEAQEALNFDHLPDRWYDKCSIVPFQGVGGTSSFLLVIKPDWIHIHLSNQMLTVNRVLIGLQFGTLSPDDSYQCLMHPHLLKEYVVHSA
ncbi:sigma-E processing peptidase SpoIIGA [Pontibacillus litoralis]|uniref:Sporulation sigma-E factor-processing peptidase n=1 Tax=Pontibacillus litoralis JSM 072002 TaxID=1385512 RepID=A0A0A5G5Z9_9BACI|nr:sigma-E processing peptidase SpoIIGA [Pontibacillus litoralis]KGX88531.1 stage II sporulation protein GA [Pontibacillus litoralis JSM 072002]